MRHLQVPSGAGHVAWDSECVCMHVYACARVYLYRVPMCILVPPSRMYMHVCTCVCTCVHAYGCVDVCACVSWVEMPLFRGSDRALLQNAVLRVAAPEFSQGSLTACGSS